MYFKQFLDERNGCASYLIASRQSNQAAVVDPSIEVAQYEAVLRDREFRLAFVIDTHVHADHVSGARLLVERHGGNLRLHESADVVYPFHALHDGEDLELGQLRLQVWHTPGHRPESISILIANPPRSPEPSMALTADSLLVGDVGRPDFHGGDAARQYASMGRLHGLPDWVAVFPGHFEGACGKGMCGRPSTTIGFERLFNPMLQLDESEFVANVSGSVPARPLNMTAIEATNRGLADLPWAMLTSAPAVEEIDVEVLAASAGGIVLIDVREPQEFASGHIPGAWNLPQADLASRLAEIPRDQSAYLVCSTGARSRRAAQFLRQVGYPRAATVRDGVGAWERSGRGLDRAAVMPDAPEVIETVWAHAGVRAT